MAVSRTNNLRTCTRVKVISLRLLPGSAPVCRVHVTGVEQHAKEDNRHADHLGPTGGRVLDERAIQPAAITCAASSKPDNGDVDP